MRNRSVSRLCVLLLLVTLTVPSLAHAQSNSRDDRDKLWNGILIGAGIGAAVGMFVGPQVFCGAQDTECSMIVRATFGVISIGGGIGIGALVDGLQSRDARPKLSGMQFTVNF